MVKVVRKKKPAESEEVVSPEPPGSRDVYGDMHSLSVRVAHKAVLTSEKLANPLLAFQVVINWLCEMRGRCTWKTGPQTLLLSTMWLVWSDVFVEVHRIATGSAFTGLPSTGAPDCSTLFRDWSVEAKLFLFGRGQTIHQIIRRWIVEQTEKCRLNQKMAWYWGALSLCRALHNVLRTIGHGSWPEVVWYPFLELRGLVRVARKKLVKYQLCPSPESQIFGGAKYLIPVQE